MNPFNQADYIQNPKKYAQFKTATIAKTVTSSPGMDEGVVVQIEFLADTKLKSTHGAIEHTPLYKAWLPGAEKSDYSVLYARALKNFVL